MPHRRVVFAVLFALLVSSCAARPRGEARLLKGPYLQDLRQDAVTVMWEAGGEVPARVLWRESGTDAWRGAPVHARPMKASYVEFYSGGGPRARHVLYTSTIRGLAPGRSYEYALRFGDEEPRKGGFRTLVRPGQPFRFVAYGDSRSQPNVHHQVCEGIRKSAPLFVIHTGDLVGDGCDYDEWDCDFFGPGRDLFMNVPVFPVLGNHESNSHYFYEFFQLPSQREYYWSLDCGDVHFAAVDPLQDWWSGSRQVRWLREDLKNSRARWNIVVVHYPSFSRSTAHYSDRATRDVLQPILAGSKVDFVIAGHNHVYERTRPIVNGFDGKRGLLLRQASSPPGPTVHVITGGGGAPLYGIDPVWWTAAWKQANHFCVFDVTPDRLTMQVFDTDGKVIDRFVITKPGGGSSPEIEKDVIYFEEIRLDESLRKSIGRTWFPGVGAARSADFDLTFNLQKKFPYDVDVRLEWDTGGTGWTVAPASFEARLGDAGGKATFHFRYDATGSVDPPRLKLRTRTILAERTVEIPLSGYHASEEDW